MTLPFVNEHETVLIYTYPTNGFYYPHTVFSLILFSPRNILIAFDMKHKNSNLHVSLLVYAACGNSCAVSSRLQTHFNDTHRLVTPPLLKPANPMRGRVSRADKTTVLLRLTEIEIENSMRFKA